MTAKQSLWADLDTSLQQDLDITNDLKTLLGKERHALEGRDYGSFNQQLDDKKSLLTQLDQNSNHRQQLLQQLGFENERDTLLQMRASGSQRAQVEQGMPQRLVSDREVSGVVRALRQAQELFSQLPRGLQCPAYVVKPPQAPQQGKELWCFPYLLT